jgi:hypothetical protein
VSQYKYGRVTSVINDSLMESFQGITAAICGDYSPHGAHSIPHRVLCCVRACATSLLMIEQKSEESCKSS